MPGTSGSPVSEAIKKARSNAGFSQAELAGRLGASAGYVGQLETGRTNPTVAQLELLAAALGCRLRISMEPIEIRHPVTVPEDQAALIRQ